VQVREKNKPRTVGTVPGKCRSSDLVSFYNLICLGESNSESVSNAVELVGNPVRERAHGNDGSQGESKQQLTHTQSGPDRIPN
jgi:hypothetical protein